MSENNANLDQMWDIAYNDNPTSDYSRGATMKITHEGGQHSAKVIDAIQDKWKASDLARVIIQYYEKYRPSHVFLGKSNGVMFLVDNIRNLAPLYGSDIVEHIYLRDEAPGSKTL